MDLAAMNLTMRKQVTKLQARESAFKKINDFLKEELASKWGVT